MNTTDKLAGLRGMLARHFPGLTVNANASLWKSQQGEEYESFGAGVQSNGVVLFCSYGQETPEACFADILAQYKAKIDEAESKVSCSACAGTGKVQP